MTLSLQVRNKAVSYDARHELMINRLCNNTTKDDKSAVYKVFTDYKDLMVFAAMVGRKYDKFKPCGKNKTKSIALYTYEARSNSTDAQEHQHVMMYLLQLSKNNQDFTDLKEENIDKVIATFEGYCGGGLDMMDKWLARSAFNPEVLLTEMINILPEEYPNGNTDIKNPF